MFIVWGTNVVRKYHGRMADFCEFCRDFHAVRVIEIRSSDHVQGYTIGSPMSHGYELTCESCGLVRTDKDPDAAVIVLQDEKAGIDELLAETNPDARRSWAGRLAFEDRLRAGGLTPGERAAALSESFLLADAIVSNRAQAIRFDVPSGIGCFVTIAAVVATSFVASSLGMSGSSVRRTALAVAAVLGCFTLIVLVNDHRRFARRRVQPILVRAIRPIRPSQDEIEATLKALRDRKHKLGKLLKAEDIQTALLLQSD
jgi:hypothetical protein